MTVIHKSETCALTYSKFHNGWLTLAPSAGEESLCFLNEYQSYDQEKLLTWFPLPPLYVL